MYKKIIIFLFLSTNINAQNLTDGLGRKQGKWVTVQYSDSLPEKKIIVECFYLNDTIEGLVQKFDSLRTLRFEVVVYKGKKQGIGRSYDSKGQLKELTVFVDDEFVERIYIDRKKRILNVEQYRNGLLNGRQIDYYSNGKINRITPYDNGKINGHQIIYKKNGKIKYVFMYEHDILKY